MLSLLYLRDYLQCRRNEKLSRAELEQRQKEAFRELVGYCYEESPYYRRLIKERGISLKEPKLESFPILSKEEIQTNFDDLVTDRRIKRADLEHFVLDEKNSERLYLDRYHVTKTSGTSGSPGYFLQTSPEVVQGISPSYRGQNGLKLRTKLAFVGFTRAYASSTMTMGFSRRFMLTRLLFDYRLIPIEQPLEDVVAELNRLQPDIVCGYAKILLLLASEQNQGRLRIQPKSLNSGGEQLFSTDRRYIEECFKAPVHNQYGSTEHLVMGFGRSEWGGMFLCEDRLIFEIRSDDTLVTNLFNRTLPMIRYRTKDVLVQQPAPVGDVSFPFTFVSDRIGRADEIPIFTSTLNGKVMMHPICFDRLMPDEVKTFQIVSLGENQVEFRIVMREGVLPESSALGEVETRVQELFRGRDLAHVRARVRLVSDLAKNEKSQKTLFWREAGVGAGAAL